MSVGISCLVEVVFLSNTKWPKGFIAVNLISYILSLRHIAEAAVGQTKTWFCSGVVLKVLRARRAYFSLCRICQVWRVVEFSDKRIHRIRQSSHCKCLLFHCLNSLCIATVSGCKHPYTIVQDGERGTMASFSIRACIESIRWPFQMSVCDVCCNAESQREERFFLSSHPC